jgi:hypothetical protein
MSSTGSYLDGFTDHRFQPAAELRGLGGAPIRTVAFRDVAAVVSRHPVQRLMPLRSNLEPHHRIVRHVSGAATLLPAAFGHISDTDDDIVGVLRENYEDIRQELDRLHEKCEMTVKLSWKVDNIFDFIVRGHRELRSLRDRVFSAPHPTMNDKLQVGSMFDATLNRERERLTTRLLNLLDAVTCEVVTTPARDEKSILNTALLVERRRTAEFLEALGGAADQFDSNVTIDCSGPWPPYSFVHLRLQARTPIAAA